MILSHREWDLPAANLSIWEARNGVGDSQLGKGGVLLEGLKGSPWGV